MGELSFKVGRVVYQSGASCLLKWSKLSSKSGASCLGRVLSGASCLGAICLWGELSVILGQLVLFSNPGRFCPGLD